MRGLGPKCGAIAAVAAASAMTPKTTSKPATSEVVVSSSRERVSRRSPSSRVRANISCGSGASSGWSVSGSSIIAGSPFPLRARVNQLPADVAK